MFTYKVKKKLKFFIIQIVDMLKVFISITVFYTP